MEDFKMDAEYDSKFEEMKKYIPFLENMITRLESTNTSSSNPRQAQLDKIRSLRDLLYNKKKRMKMENLLKCEQVLVNLYAKVEQRDTLSNSKKETDSGFSIDAPTPKEKSDLEAVRNKLKIAAKRQESVQDTLPEILPRSEVNDVQTSGTKEPALFQRRPNHTNYQDTEYQNAEQINNSPPGSASKRNYTRVLVSPEPSSRRWSPSEAPADKPLFSRRSPRKSPRRVSPSYHKKERKKSKDRQSRKQKDLNITLNVPEESLNSLNTKDILSRIINCSDGDVDIETLRKLRKQILGELQKTGAKDDISDLILKSYNKNLNQSNKSKATKKEETEEGELSDSESEAIESIYGSLVVKEPSFSKTSSETDSQPRKIQICLVINSDSKSEVKMNELPKQDNTDLAELEMFEGKDDGKINVENEVSKNDDHQNTTKITTVILSKDKTDDKTTVAFLKDKTDDKTTVGFLNDKTDDKTTAALLKDNADDKTTAELSKDKNDDKTTVPLSKDNTNLGNSQKVAEDCTDNDIKIGSVEEKTLSSEKEVSHFKANFYKPLTEPSYSEDGDSEKKEKVCAQVITDSVPNTSNNMFQFESSLKQNEKSSEIPLLHDRTIEKQPADNTLSEIDILQALKNEILSEITVPGTESTTPLLHQPKVMKVANAQANQILPKKRISIEKYKEKSVTSSQSNLNKTSYKDENIKKTSLKLTDKECERFFNVPKISFDDEDESLEADGDGIEASDVYGDLAPKSPDNEHNMESTPPVIIPVDPIKSVSTSYKADIDMRALPPLSPNNTNTKTVYNDKSTINDSVVEKIKVDIKTDQNQSQHRPLLIDPRVRRDLNTKTSTHSPNPHANNPERTPRQTYTGLPSNSAKMTPNSRTYEMTPTHQAFEIEQSNRKHVYASMSWETTDSVGDRRSRIDEGRESRWKPKIDDVAQSTKLSDLFNKDTYSHGPAYNRYMDQREDLYRSDGSITPAFLRSDVTRNEGPMMPLPAFVRSDCPATPLPSFGRSDCPSTPLPSFGRSECPPTPLPSFGRSDCPTTPLPSFGRSDCPTTPLPSFGRSDCPPTPNHPFGRLECPMTPTHSFGRLECPSTPSHPFGRLDCPPTPSHSFGRMDCPTTPSHPFGRSECSPTPIHPFGRSDAASPLMVGISECPNASTTPFIGADTSTTSTTLFGRNEIGPSSGKAYSKVVPQIRHSYGRTDSLKNQFSRSDYNASKDPRLNRKSDSESKLQYDERDQSYNNEKDRYHGASYSLQKSYTGSGSYRHRDRESSAGRNSRYRYFSPDQSARHFNKDQDRRDRVDRSQSKDHESSRSYGRERWYNSDHRSLEGVHNSRREYISKNTEPGSGYKERNFSEKAPTDNTKDSNSMSVKSNTGRPFTIDTSINTTFQQNIDSGNEIKGVVSSFDVRKQRAGSVGRSLTREPSVGRIPTQIIKDYKNEDKRRAFQRASSVGREVLDSKIDKRSFQEIKADFKSCTFSGDQFFNDIDIEPFNNKSKLTTDSGHNSKTVTCEKKINESEQVKSSYSPGRNYRDPRMRKLATKKIDNYGPKSGIVYSNDKIVSGSVLTSGYGVRNYKIPKIKRITTEEKEEVLIKTDYLGKDNDKDKNSKKETDGKSKSNISKEKLDPKDQIEKMKQDEITVEKDKVTVNKNCESIVLSDSAERRLTRSHKKSMEEAKLVTAGKPRKFKKLIYDSDSGDDMETESKDIKIKESATDSKNIDTKGKDFNKIGIDTDEVMVNKQDDDSKNDPKKQDNDETKDGLSEYDELNTESRSENVELKSQGTTIGPFDAPIIEKLSHLDQASNFDMDELEIFSDNVVSDPVIENITDLIADLDNDLNTTKSDSSHHFTKEITLENMMDNISTPSKNRLPVEVEKEDSTTILEDSKQKNIDNKTEASSSKEIPCENKFKTDAVVKNHLETPHLENSAGNTPTDNETLNTIDNKSNVDSTTESELIGKPKEDKLKSDENVDGCSTPDSTINTDDVLKLSNDESLQGSTNEVTSTESIEPKPVSAKEISSGFDSIGSLLSILQNKSKIKELLSMLGDQSNENEKIKKKLEKLSEIASDDEESCDKPTTNIEPEVDKLMSAEITDTNTIDCKEVEDADNSQVSRDSSINNENVSKLEDDDSRTSDIESDLQCKSKDISNVEDKSKKNLAKKTKNIKKTKGKAKKDTIVAVKRITRAAAAETKPKVKKIPRELMQLQEDIKEMFIRDEVLSVTGIRMCRLAKLVDEKISPSKEEQNTSESSPIVVLEKCKDATNKNIDTEKNKKKKTVTKVKPKTSNDSFPDTIKEDKAPTTFKHKPGPRSKTKMKKNSDPYVFESDSVCDSTPEKASEDGSSSNTDSESDSLASCKSFGSTEILSDLKRKTKRKRGGWQTGVIKTKTKKKKELPKKSDVTPVNSHDNIHHEVLVPDLNCYTDRNYCFQKNQFSYSCRLCSFTGTDIVLHYRNQHPHTEIPLSRMSPEVAKEAIEQCVEINFKAISKLTSDKYVCTFCFKEFSYSKSILETFFWHIVSMHTGEYKQNCSECINVHDCPFNLDIPPPPKDTKGQIIGYICKKCNFTQISLENLKTHVIVRHNDEQTAVYTINMSVMNKKKLISLKEISEHDEISQVRNCTSDHDFTDINEKSEDSAESDENERVKTFTASKKSNASITPPIQSKITFEGDDNISEASDLVSEPGEMNIKLEKIDSESADVISINEKKLATDVFDKTSNIQGQLTSQPLECSELQPSSDIINCSHFKINVAESGAKEYLCCINDSYHFKTTLLISMKKHVQTKHAENWDGYCYMCKVIVTPQGTHCFSDCLQHYLDKHMDDFPILEKEIKKSVSENVSVKNSYINVRPLSELTKSEDNTNNPESASLPVIQSVISLGSADVETPQLNSIFPAVMRKKEEESKTFKYEEHQAEVISKKYYLVIEAMMNTNNLVKLFKCSGRYCLYATDSTEEALAHATTHQRLGGIEALNCCYCDFDSAGNAVDLVMHVFKTHGNCHYCCQQCFYRAASSQAVGVHISRVHGVIPIPGSVLRTTSISTIQTNFKMLSREEAVSYYICGHKDNGDSCKFRAYTPDKFCDHLQQRHSTASAHPCQACETAIATPTELIQHMKSHGLKLYQCTWCVHGADNESEMLTHVSIVHPNRLPQAYIRIITNKDGFNALRVLPLAFLTKQKVEAKDVTPSATKEHPVREAERSIEMEALIGPFMTEPIQQSVYQTTETPLDTSEILIHSSEIPEELLQSSQDIKPALNVDIPKQIEEISQVIQPSNTTSIVTTTIPTDTVAPSSSVTVPLLPSLTVPSTLSLAVATISPVVLPLISSSSTYSQDETPATISTVMTSSLVPSDTQLISLKPEPVDTEKTVSADVVVLDSDEEDLSAPNQNVIDLSDEEASTSLKQATSKIICRPNLYTCPQCKQICKNMGGFKKHVYSCITDHKRSLQCPHCQHNAENLDKIILHYIADHTLNGTFECGLCGTKLLTENFARKHMRSIHKESSIKFTRSDKAIVVTAMESQKDKVIPKRKLSGPKTDPIPAKRKFEPQEIDQLPINPILDQLVYCSRCEFSTKVRLNMVRHLQLHAEQQPVPQTAPVNPVPHLESNEKHFDKMLNLASSSIANRAPEKSRVENTPSVTLLVPPEAASRYPKYVPERQRHTCGAKGCSYISVDEAMLRRHWDALHSGTSDFHCVHCPPHQHLDTSKPLTATRIVSHLKMHDSTLYACSACSYYHFKREALEKHLSEIHKNGRLMVVREKNSAPVAPAPVQNTAAPTMDLKPWQCGLCKFKSMLRPEVVDHCSKVHQSKMQFKCAYCPFRTSAIENVAKHQSNSHVGKSQDIFYYYYREGSIPDESDGTPRWMKQRQKVEPSEPSVPSVKVETSASPPPKAKTATVTSPLAIDLNLVKKEASEVVETGLIDMHVLCEKFGQFCEPNGIKYKCPLCSVVIEDTRELMQSHLFEELNYRKWSCGLCSYKAFHKVGLTEHMSSEHRRQYDHIELPTDINIDRWVAAVLDHQTTIIKKYKDNLVKQSIVVENNRPGPSVEIVLPKESVGKYSDKDLEATFGSFGSPSGIMYCCPKCNFLSKDEVSMRDHLEIELNKIRWCCTNCTDSFQTYHEAQFHCKGHDGPSRPKEALRDPAMRAAWVSTTIEKQKQVIQEIPTASVSSSPDKLVPDSDNSLLVVRYEENVVVPSQLKRKRPIQDSDDERLVIDEMPNKKGIQKYCPYCDYKSVHNNALKSHMLTHFGLKPFSCAYCTFTNSTKKGVSKHIEQKHPNKPIIIKATGLPVEVKTTYTKTFICLVCEDSVPEHNTHTHLHNNVKPEFASPESKIVYKCNICSNLCLDPTSLLEHNKTAHPEEPVDYVQYKLGVDTREHKCAYCDTKFRFIKDYRTHHVTVHPTLPFKMNLWSSVTTPEVKGSDVVPPVSKRCARKSTTKLPNSVAKKSTTKLPNSVRNVFVDEYSYYGTKAPPLQQYGNVTTLMSFCNKMIPFSLKQLSEHINIEPQVVVSDIKNSSHFNELTN